MNPEDEQRAHEILPGALERSGEERQTSLLKMCGQDDELLTRVPLLHKTLKLPQLESPKVIKDGKGDQIKVS